jgi:hypothetical protein
MGSRRSDRGGGEAMTAIDAVPIKARYIEGDSIALTVEFPEKATLRLTVRRPGRKVLSRDVEIPADRSELELGAFPCGGYSASLGEARAAFDVPSGQ